MNYNSPKPTKRVIMPGSPLTPQKRSSPDYSGDLTPKQFTLNQNSTAEGKAFRDSTAYQTMLETPSPRKKVCREDGVLTKAKGATGTENAVTPFKAFSSPSPAQRFIAPA